MGTDNAYIYGESNGSSYQPIEGDGQPGETKVHWDPRVEVKTWGGHGVQVGVVPSSDSSDDIAGIWDPEDGQYLTLDWAGCNRLIVAIREARDKVFGKPE